MPALWALNLRGCERVNMSFLSDDGDDGVGRRVKVPISAAGETCGARWCPALQHLDLCGVGRNRRFPSTPSLLTLCRTHRFISLDLSGHGGLGDPYDMLDDHNWLPDSDCCGVTNEVVSAIADVSGAGLRRLQLSACVWVGGHAVESIQTQCRGLELLDLSHCIRIANFNMMSALGNLRVLVLDYTRAGAGTLFLVACAVRHLQKVSMRGCSGGDLRTKQLWSRINASRVQLGASGEWRPGGNLTITFGNNTAKGKGEEGKEGKEGKGEEKNGGGSGVGGDGDDGEGDDGDDGDAGEGKWGRPLRDLQELDLRDTDASSEVADFEGLLVGNGRRRLNVEQQRSATTTGGGSTTDGGGRKQCGRVVGHRSCTARWTGRLAVPTTRQPMYHCADCGLVPSMNLGACGACVASCHAGHKTWFGSVADFFCDCFYTGTCGETSAETKDVVGAGGKGGGRAGRNILYTMLNT